MAEKIILVGAGDHGRGVLEILRRMREAGRPVEVIGFADDGGASRSVDGVPVLGTIDWLAAHLKGLEAAVILSMASPGAKRRIAGRLAEVGARWGTAIHPRAELAPSVTVGPGSVINAGVAIVYEARIGAHVTINLNATVGHHVMIGDHVTIAPGANILGKVRLGEGCQVHANAVILPSLTIGAGATVGAGSVVLADVPAETTVFGNPARVVPVRPATA
jgi:sugar O-acyltransferase (sialic acid O-acetyltransferase NeuD family)